MKSIYQSRGKGEFQRWNWKHIPENPFEATILELLASIRNLQHGYYADTCGGASDGWDYFLLIEEKQSELSAILA